MSELETFKSIIREIEQRVNDKEFLTNHLKVIQKFYNKFKDADKTIDTFMEYYSFEQKCDKEFLLTNNQISLLKLFVDTIGWKDYNGVFLKIKINDHEFFARGADKYYAIRKMIEGPEYTIEFFDDNNNAIPLDYTMHCRKSYKGQ